MPPKKRSAPEAASSERRRSGRITSTPKKSSYWESSDNESDDAAGPPTKKAKLSKSRRSSTKKEVEEEYKAESEAADDDNDDDEVDENAPMKVEILPLEKLRGTGGVEYADHKLHKNSMLFLKDLKANNRRPWLKCKMTFLSVTGSALTGYLQPMMESSVARFGIGSRL